MSQEPEVGASSPSAPGTSLRDLYSGLQWQLMAAARNAVAAQQQADVTAQSALTMGIATLYSLDTSAVSIATEHELNKQS